jgi:hypothetical protein
MPKYFNVVLRQNRPGVELIQIIVELFVTDCPSGDFIPMKAPVRDISADEFKPLSMYGRVSPVFDRGIGSRRAGTFDTSASYQ